MLATTSSRSVSTTRSSSSRAWKSSASVGREVLVVFRAAPVTAPTPTDRAEGADELAAWIGHAAPDSRAVQVRAAGSVRYRAARRHVGILDWIDIDRQAVGVVRPVRGAGGRSAVEGRGVVGLDRAEVAAAVGVDESHAPDREAGPVQLAEDADDLLRDGAIHDQPPGMGAVVEAPVAEREQAQAR